MDDTLRVGIIQARPAYYDLEASLSRAAEWVKRAADQGVRLAVFGETWLPGYPAWLDHCPDMGLWDHAPTKEVYARLHANSVSVPGRAVDALSTMARTHDMVIVMGINERVDSGPGSGTLYNSLLTFEADGSLVNHHRKLIPTYTERIVWGQGDAAGLQAVDTAAGRISGLVCWEHWMPLARQALHDSHEQIHIAAWPTVHEMHQIASRQYAFEGRCYVLAAGSIMPAADLPPELDKPPNLADDPDQLVLRGGAAIIGPDGKYVAGPVFDEETILIADIDLNEIVKERMTLDTSGHYSRPDIFTFDVDRRRPGGQP